MVQHSHIILGMDIYLEVCVKSKRNAQLILEHIYFNFGICIPEPQQLHTDSTGKKNAETNK